MIGWPGAWASVNTIGMRVVSAATTKGPRCCLKRSMPASAAGSRAALPSSPDMADPSLSRAGGGAAAVRAQGAKEGDNGGQQLIAPGRYLRVLLQAADPELMVPRSVQGDRAVPWPPRIPGIDLLRRVQGRRDHDG